jgi:hypothetical protein
MPQPLLATIALLPFAKVNYAAPLKVAVSVRTVALNFEWMQQQHCQQQQQH